MTPEEAIEKLSDLKEDMEQKTKETYAKAIQLGIEALEAIKEIRTQFDGMALLPSETEKGK